MNGHGYSRLSFLQTVFSMAGLAPKVPKIEYHRSTVHGYEDRPCGLCLHDVFLKHRLWEDVSSLSSLEVKGRSDIYIFQYTLN